MNADGKINLVRGFEDGFSVTMVIKLMHLPFRFEVCLRMRNSVSRGIPKIDILGDKESPVNPLNLNLL